MSWLRLLSGILVNVVGVVAIKYGQSLELDP